MNDKYAKAAKYLKRNPGMIVEAWNFPNKPFGCLFRHAGKTATTWNGKWIGCLTQVKCGMNVVAQNQRLTTAILEDERIPTSPEEITVDNLHVFVEWQRRLDKELKRAT